MDGTECHDMDAVKFSLEGACVPGSDYNKVTVNLYQNSSCEAKARVATLTMKSLNCTRLRDFGVDAPGSVKVGCIPEPLNGAGTAGVFVGTFALMGLVFLLFMWSERRSNNKQTQYTAIGAHS